MEVEGGQTEIQSLMEELGVPRENIELFQNSSVKELSTAFDEMQAHFACLAESQRRSCMIVFCQGYGIQDWDDEQAHVLNQNEKVLIEVQKTLESISKTCEGMCHVFTIFNTRNLDPDLLDILANRRVEAPVEPQELRENVEQNRRNKKKVLMQKSTRKPEKLSFSRCYSQIYVQTDELDFNSGACKSLRNFVRE